MEVVLFRPEIPQNTGNIGRTCVAVGAELTLVKPIGFSLEDRFLKRAGMDYWERLKVNLVNDLEGYLNSKYSLCDLIFFSTKGTKNYYEADLSFENRCLIFGSEGSGLPSEILDRYRNNLYTLPMIPGNRSLNLATTVGVALYESVRQKEIRRHVFV
ncbi:MAG: tRNA (cytidine(34)-2'-O)-methyltransferase [Victivallaceae bacterium]